MAKGRKNMGQQQAQKGTSVQTSGLELPEGYNPKKSKAMKGGRKPTKLDRKIAQAEAAVLPSPARARINPVAQARLTQRADEYGLDMNPRAGGRKLAFQANRTWRSIDNPNDFLKAYETYQQRKLGPQVFADEKPQGDPDRGPEYVTWYQKSRYAYYKSEGRLGRLEVLEKTKNWPSNSGTITKAPFVRASPKDYRYAENMVNRELPLFKMCQIRELAMMILKLVPNFRDLASLSQTCNAGLDLVSKHLELWDITPPGNYLGDNHKDRSNPRTEDDSEILVPLALVVSPMRRSASERHAIVETETEPKGEYQQEFYSTYQLFRALLSRSTTVTRLQLHRIQFLDLRGLQCVLSSMKMLEHIGIYQCPLLHLGKTSEIIELVRIHPNHHWDTVHLDFFPAFHQGPNSISRHGSFGITWNSSDVDITAGVMQMVVWELYPKAKEIGMDLFELGSGFRDFLERCPLTDWAVVRAYEAIKTLEHNGIELNDDAIRAYNTSNVKYQRFADDLAAALFGDNVEPQIISGARLGRIMGTDPVPNQIRKFGWWRIPKICYRCSVSAPAMFFPFPEDRCWNCTLKDHLELQQWDHFKTLKARVAKQWFFNCYTLNDVVNNTKRSDAAETTAKMIDYWRAKEMTRNHGRDEVDDINHPDFQKVVRRHARAYEPHGPVDRRLADVQYWPLGHFGARATQLITCRIAARAFAEEEFGRDWRHERWCKHPQDTAEQTQQAWDTFVEANTDMYLREWNRRDNVTITAAANSRGVRTAPPNPHGGLSCWDRRTEQMLIASRLRDDNGREIELPSFMRSSHGW